MNKKTIGVLLCGGLASGGLALISYLMERHDQKVFEERSEKIRQDIEMSSEGIFKQLDEQHEEIMESTKELQGYLDEIDAKIKHAFSETKQQKMKEDES